MKTLTLQSIAAEFPQALAAAKKLVANPQRTLSQRQDADELRQWVRAQGLEGVVQAAVAHLEQDAKKRVSDYDTGVALRGSVSDELVRESAAAEPTGAVPAYLDESGVWQYVQPSRVEHERRFAGRDVRTVFVEVTE